MANVNSPRGFWPLFHLNGGEIRTNKYKVKSGSKIYRGDLVAMDATGTVVQAAAGAGATVVGVAAEFVDDSAGSGTKTILVYDDPNIVFGVQATTAAAADIGANADHSVGTGSDSTGISGNQLDGATIGGTTPGDQLKIIGKIESVDNDWGSYVKVMVLINEHLYKAAVAGV